MELRCTSKNMEFLCNGNMESSVIYVLTLKRSREIHYLEGPLRKVYCLSESNFNFCRLIW